MNVLITGLTLRSNKGGACLALSLIETLKKEKCFSGAKYYLSVIPESMELEKKWLDVYRDIDGLIGSVNYKNIILPFSLLNKYRCNKTKYLQFIEKIDVIIDLTALSYMDIEHFSFLGNFKRNLNNYINRYYSTKKDKKMIRWTQSYGPFRSLLTKRIIRNDLKHQKYIFARGEASALSLKEVLPADSKIYIFPDIAIVMPYRVDYADSIDEEKYVTVSPSSMLYNIQKDKYISSIVDLVNYVHDFHGFKVVLLPFNLVAERSSPERCDLSVCNEVNNRLINKAMVISEDLDVYNLKGIISKAYAHVGSRYHSIVASLSTHVPCISIGWHDKYKEIMDMYGVGNYVHDVRNNDFESIYSLFDNLIADHDSISDILQKKNVYQNNKISENLKLFIEMMNEM